MQLEIFRVNAQTNLNKLYLIFLLIVLNSNHLQLNALHKIYTSLALPQQASFGWANGVRWAEMLALSPYIHSSCITWCAILELFLLYELAHLCVLCSKESLLMRFTFFVLAFGILLAITDSTSVGYSLHQVNSHSASHLSRAANTWLLLSNLAPWLKIWLKTL